MNPFDNQLHRDRDDKSSDEDVLIQRMQILKTIAPTATSIEQLRQDVCNALTDQVASRMHKPWFAQSIAIPVPAAAAVCLVLIGSWIALASALLRFHAGDVKAIASPSSEPSSEPTATSNVANVEPRTETVIQSTYLCGVGRIQYNVQIHSAQGAQ